MDCGGRPRDARALVGLQKQLRRWPRMDYGGRPRDARALFAAEAGLMMRGLSLMITQLGLVLVLMLMLMLELKQAKH